MGNSDFSAGNLGAGDGPDRPDGANGANEPNAGSMPAPQVPPQVPPKGGTTNFQPTFASELERRRYEMMEWQEQAAYDFSQEAGCTIADAKVYVEAKYTPRMLPKSHAQRRMLLSYLKEHTYGKLPLWQSISGWDKNAEYVRNRRCRSFRWS